MTLFRSLNAFSTNTGYPINDVPDISGYSSISNLQNSDIFTAINVVSNDIATNPIKLESNNVNEITSNKFRDLNYLLNVRPNEFMTARYFKYAMTANMLLNGNAYARIWKTKSGEILELQLLQPSWVTVFQEDDTGDIYYEVQDGSHNPYNLRQDEVFHIKYLTTNGIVGVSPLYALASEVELQKGGNKLLNDFFKSGVNGSAVIKINKGALAPDARNAIRKAWLNANGTTNNSRLIVTDNTEEYSPLEVDTSILKIINSNDYSTKQIGKAFGIPISRLGLENSHTSLPQSNLDYIQNSLDHYFSRWTSEMNVKLLNPYDSKRYSFEFDVSRLLQLDPEKNAQYSIDLFKVGLIDDTEARQRIGYDKYDDKMSGKRIVISNMVPMQNIESNYPNNVIVGNAYDDDGKPIDKQKMSKTKKAISELDNDDEKGGEKNNAKEN